MGLFKIIGLASGLPLRPTTGRERARKYQRQANQLLEAQVNEMQQLNAMQHAQQQQQVSENTRPRGACPHCHEFMLVGANVCPHCKSQGITWQ